MYEREKETAAWELDQVILRQQQAEQRVTMEKREREVGAREMVPLQLTRILIWDRACFTEDLESAGFSAVVTPAGSENGEEWNGDDEDKELEYPTKYDKISSQ